MNNKILAGAGLSACALMAWAAKDPVVMTVNGVDVPRSEFEYLYHKNTQQQQLDPQPIEEYAEMFQLYKMKVADALAAGLDTTETFRKEMDKYRRDLAEPYLADSTVLLKFVDEAALQAREEVEIKHIMTRRLPDPVADAANRQLIDSIRGALLAGADFTTIATEKSQDPSAVRNHGNLGFMAAGRLPYNFEKAAFSLSEGDVSEIVESPAGYHIIMGGKHRPARGRLHASHIMKMCRPGSSAEDEAKAKASIDSIYAVLLTDPNKFESIAMAESDDKNSGRQGGLLPWFGAGEMVSEFDEAAFALADGEISKPVRSQFGWHIIKRLAQQPPLTKEQIKPEVLSRLNNPQDDRFPLVMKAANERLSAKHQGKLNDALVAQIKEYAAANGIDSVFFATYSNSNTPIATIGKKQIPVSEFVKGMNGIAQPSPIMAAKMLDQYLLGFYNRELTDAEINWLVANEPDYRNLLNEYHDGSLLYEISLQKVWNKATEDKEGLENYFNANRSKYTWDAPHVKGILVQAANDSVAGLIRERMGQLGNDTIISTIRKEFPRQVQLDRVLVKKGENAMVDNLMFGGEAVTPSNSRYTVYFLFDPRKLEAPENAMDVKGRVTSDYQAELEKEWVADMKNRYSVKINQKELKKIK